LRYNEDLEAIIMINRGEYEFEETASANKSTGSKSSQFIQETAQIV